MNVATILAAGRGKRFGAEIPKQFVRVLGKPILAYTLETFQRSADIDAIQIVCQEEERDRVERIVRGYGIDKVRWITPGGSTCPASIRNAVCGLREALDDGDIVVLHMGISPLISLKDIASSISRCGKKGCCFTMHPVRICMARGGGDGWAGVDAPKEDYVELNTPWAFRYGDVYGLYRQLDEEGYALSETDYTLSLWLAAGRKAWYIPGSEQGRMKITTCHDRDLFEGYLLLKQMGVNKLPQSGLTASRLPQGGSPDICGASLSEGGGPRSGSEGVYKSKEAGYGRLPCGD